MDDAASAGSDWAPIYPFQVKGTLATATKLAPRRLAVSTFEGLARTALSRHSQSVVENLGGAYSYERETVPREWFGGAPPTAVRGHAPRRARREWDEYLTHLYGDYMQLPPEDERVSNHDFSRATLTEGDNGV